MFPVGFTAKIAVKEAVRRNNGERVLMPFLVSQEETKFLEKLNVELKDLKPLALNCTKVKFVHFAACLFSI